MNTENASPRMGAREWAMLLTLSVFWGGSFFFNGVAVREVPTLTLVWARVAVGGLALLLLLRCMGGSLPRAPRVWGAFAFMALINNIVPFGLIVWGQQHIASGLASILNATTPLFTVLVAHVLTRDEKLTPARMAGVLSGLAGVVVMLGPDFLLGLGQGLMGQLACLLAAVSYAFAAIYGRRFRAMGIDPVSVATGQVCASALLLAGPVLLLEAPWRLAMPSVASWAAILGIGLISTAAAYVLFFRILAAAGATSLMLVTFLIPVSAILLGSLLLGEVLLGRHFLGMAAIGIGLALIDGRVLPALRVALGRGGP